MRRVGFLGTGVMGAPMAAHVARAGYELTVWNRTRARAEPLAREGARVASSAAEAARDAEALLVCVGDTPDVEAVLFGPGGAAEGLAPGTLVIDCSTVAPDGAIRIGRALEERGASFLDAPVTGGEKGAVAGTLTFIVGGTAADLERARPLLSTMGRRILHVGGTGSGQRLKLVNQLVCAIHLVAMSEGLSAARALGLDPAQARDLLVGGAARSWSLEVYGEQAIHGDFRPGFSVKWQAKDARIAAEAAAGAGLDLPGLALARARLEEALSAGWGEEGVQALIKLYAPFQAG